MRIKFKRDTSFRKQFFVPDSFAHPAKMDAQLLIWIVEHYSKEGETILDPMAGSGTTMLACTLGRNVILVELEGKFCKMCADNWEQVKMRPQLGSTMGECQIIQGDARQLEGLVDKIVTSPPYANIGVGQEASKNLIEERIRKGIAGATITEDGRYMTGNGKYLREYSSSKDNIGNLPYGEIDKCIFSPPYAESKEIHDFEFLEDTAGEFSDKYKSKKIKGHFASKEAIERALKKKQSGYPEDPSNIGNLSYGQIDKIVTSPPYSLTVQKGHEGVQAWKVIEGLKDADNKTLRAKSKELADKGIIVNQYGESEDNIGNLKSQSYLEAMLQVYQSCFSVLKNGGLMVLVCKNFIRQKKVVRLDLDTIKLCEQAGFSFVERHYRELPSQSFWRVIYHQKFPDVEQILNEDVLVFRR